MSAISEPYKQACMCNKLSMITYNDHQVVHGASEILDGLTMQES